MIQKISHTTVYVLDQDRARAFYCDKLGFEVRTDARLEGFRWLTVGPKGQPDLELVLMALQPGPMMDADTVEQLKRLVQKGVLGAGVFSTPDCRKTYDELKKKGVTFLAEPAERPYGIEAILKDDEGNWFSLTQPTQPRA